MLRRELKYSYSDISVVPAIVSEIKSRSECNPLWPDGYLPLFTAPMDSVVGEKSYKEYEKRGIKAILPRTVPLEKRIANKKGWSAYSLGEFEDYFVKRGTLPLNNHALVDVANGHMKYLIDLAAEAKKKHGKSLTVMIGNIANPETYTIIDKAGIDYVRVGIGTGRGCITSSNTAIHYPPASLLAEISEKKGRCKVVADGGVRGYRDIIIALALGADYVMVGSVFTKMLESESPIIGDATGVEYREGKFWIGQLEVSLEKEFYGMASKKGQQALGVVGKGTTSEGLITILPVEYTMDSWVKNFKDYLRSAMSYTGHATLEDFTRMTDCIILGGGASGAVNR